jgi:hypothetical protein
LVRKVTLKFAPFGWAGLDRAVCEEGVTPAELVSRAAAYLVSDLGSGRPELEVLAVEGSDSFRSVDLELELPATTYRAIELEAARQNVTPEELLEHATVYYLADLGSGRATERILRSVEGEPQP